MNLEIVVILFCFFVTLKSESIVEKLQKLYKTKTNDGQHSLKENLFMEQKDITLIYFEKFNPEVGILIKYEDVQNLEQITSYNRSLNSVIYIHGWLDGCNNTNDAIRNAIMMYHDVNYMELCWDKYAYTEYITSRSSISNVAKFFGNYLTAMISNVNLDLGRLTVIGHSLGAHIAGIASDDLNKSVGAILGLDPAGPFVFDFEKDRLTSNSAIYVQAIHTDSSFLGVNYNVGNADFWPNGGRSQPGCPFDIFGQCSHLRSIAYYAESIASGRFYGRLCDKSDQYESGDCNVNLERSMGGYPLDTTIVGDFFLNTNSSSPYALGHYYP